MNALRKIFWISLGLKLLVAAVLPLTSDEAYYWVWSQYPQLSYYDHPPFVSWLYWLGDKVNFYNGMVRWPGVLLGHATLALWLKLLAPFLNQKQRLYWLLLALLSPLVGGSGILVTPDLPLMFFYALSLFLYFKWERSPDVRISLAFGFAMGLGFSSKYMMVLFALSLLPLVLSTPSLRRSLIKSLPWLVVGATLGTLPVWLWNFMHDFASIKFQTAHGLGRKFWKPSWTIEYVLLQVALIFPVILYWAIKAKGQLPKVFHWLAWVPLGFFFFTTFRGYVEGNWPISGYPAILALAVSGWPHNSRSLKLTLFFWAALIGVALVLILAQPEWSRSFKFKEFHQFDNLVAASAQLDPLYARSYQMAAKLHFELKRPVFKLKGMNRKDFYDFIEPSTPTSKIFYWAVEKGDHLPPAYLGYRTIETIPVDERYEIRKIEAP